MAGFIEEDEPAGFVEQPKTWGDTAMGAVQTADDAVRATANAMTFGMADRLAGFAGGEGTDAEVRKSEAARARSPYASIAGDVAGSLALPGFGAARLAQRLGGGLLARGAAYGATGAATGAAQGAGNTYTGELPDYLKNAAIGGALGGTFGAAGGSIFGNRGVRSAAQTPTIAELYADKTARYNLLNSNPAQYDAQHLAQAARDLEQRFATTADRFHRRDSPSTWRALGEMQQPYAAAVREGPAAISTVDPGNLEFIRQGINKIPPSAERAVDKASGRIVKQALAEFVENPPMGAVMPGSEAAARLASEQSVGARAANAGYKRALRSDAMLQNAQNRAASNYSGLNLENNLRQEYRSLLKLDKETGRSLAQNKGYNADEINRMQNFVEGADTRGRNALRWAAKTAGGGSGLGALAAAGVGGGVGGAYATEDPRYALMLGLPAFGLAARSAGNRLAMRNIQQLNEVLRQRNPLYQSRLATAGTVPGPGMPRTAKATRDAIALEILRARSQAPEEELY